MASTISWNRADKNRDEVHLIVQALVEGKIVVLPTETSYLMMASGLHADAAPKVARYAEAAAGPQESASRHGIAAQLILRSAEEAHDYFPALSPVAARIASRGLPGPIVLQTNATSPHGLAENLGESVVNSILINEKYLGLRLPAHEIFSQVMQLMRGPGIVAEIFDPDGQAVADAATLRTAIPESCDVIVEDGETHFGKAATVVRVDGNSCRVVRSGVVGRERLGQLSQFVTLFVCTGNTCRSPMAEVMFRDLLEKRFGDVSASGINGYHVGSAGISAFPGGSASAEAKKVMAQRGLSLGAHQSRALSEHMLQQADLVLTMTGSHRAAIIDQLPVYSNKVNLLSGSNADVSDPFGGAQAVYAACADQIEGFLTAWAERIEQSWLPKWQFD